MKHRTLPIIVAAALLAGGVGCSTNRLAERVEAREASLATFAWLTDRYGLEDDTDLQNLIKRVITRLASFSPESRAAHWTVAVIRSDDVNAFSAGTGTMVLTRGLIEQCETEAQLAAVIAHEISHHLLGHSSTAEHRADGSHPTLALSLQDELDADTLSLQLLGHAGYAPTEAVFALAIAYRPEDEKGYLPDWYQARLSNLERLAHRGGSGPYTVTSREFNKVRSRLRSGG